MEIKKDLRFRDYFLFTQHSLSTFDNCPLKFKKRYLENLKWDSFPDENIKRRLELGNDFHLLAYRYFLGIEEGLSISNDDDVELERWLKSLKNSFEMTDDTIYLPEYKLRMISPMVKLEANYDLIMVKEGALQIWDWKTHTGSSNSKGKKPKRRYQESLQTIVYLYVLKEQARLIVGDDMECSRISMIYWQPDIPHVLEEIHYSDEQHEIFRQILETKINSILNYDYDEFDKELYRKHCKLCEFNWFCNNEKVDFKAMEDSADFLDDLNWDDIEEIF